MTIQLTLFLIRTKDRQHYQVKGVLPNLRRSNKTQNRLSPQDCWIELYTTLNHAPSYTGLAELARVSTYHQATPALW
ncbi:hypothetical protein JTE90_013754 [Oedothorax gibbosus]|uniref:Uncharacterized protein n=1 Tax=Oedothorax gibbosus TaxID=931172 RepID=A0AAV6UXU3_9ARAC|nr:hypothetical protein JTE90_013754 [Oedothorax gibbosus]